MEREVSQMVDLGMVKTGIDVLEKLGFLEKLSLKLVSNPDKAARHLNVALTELETGYKALHDEMVLLGNLSFGPEQLRESRQILIRMKDGRVVDEVLSVKGSCSRIWNIYTRFLKGWFSRVLNADEAQELESLFFALGCMDGGFIQAVEDLSTKAQEFAKTALDHLDKKRMSAVESLTTDLERELAPIRKHLTDSMKRLWDLEDQFIKVGRIVLNVARKPWQRFVLIKKQDVTNTIQL